MHILNVLLIALELIHCISFGLYIVNLRLVAAYLLKALLSGALVL